MTGEDEGDLYSRSLTFGRRLTEPILISSQARRRQCGQQDDMPGNLRRAVPKNKRFAFSKMRRPRESRRISAIAFTCMTLLREKMLDQDQSGPIDYRE